MTGIPGHGGGKRFAVEQELVSGATRAAIMQIDVSVLTGKKVNIYVSTIGDKGAGNLYGGRYSVVSQIRGDYLQAPPVMERARESKQKGYGGEINIGIESKGLGSYSNSEEAVSDDLRYLSGLLETYLFLQGVIISPPSESEIDLYVIVDVFGTVRTRVDWFVANNEILKAKTALEVFGIDHQTGQLVMPPQTAAAQSEYNEQYLFWAGPLSIKTYVEDSDPLLVDFTNLPRIGHGVFPVEQKAELDYPFKHELKKTENNGESP